jgi:hypothetical protein
MNNILHLKKIPSNFGGLVGYMSNLIINYKMEDTTIRDLSDKIVKDFDKTIKNKVDYLLMLDSIMYTNLGIDSTKGEKAKVKSDSRYIYKQIKTNPKELIKILN